MGGRYKEVCWLKGTVSLVNLRACVLKNSTGNADSLCIMGDLAEHPIVAHWQTSGQSISELILWTVLCFEWFLCWTSDMLVTWGVVILDISQGSLLSEWTIEAAAVPDKNKVSNKHNLINNLCKFIFNTIALSNIFIQHYKCYKWIFLNKLGCTHSLSKLPIRKTVIFKFGSLNS